ncbi:MAG: ABC transporter permease [Spirochaeta sp.]|nr:ABC transporter permease [Spirochaeta sp.]
MTRYLIRRLFTLALTLLVTSFIIFALTNLLPGDVARLVLGRDASDTAIENFEQRFGLDRPPLVQYAQWLGGFITADWGRSYTAGSPAVRSLVLGRLGNSMRLAGTTLLIVIPLSLLLGVLASLREGSWTDSIISVASLSVVGLPEFVTGIVLINVFALQLGWFPASTYISNNMPFGEWMRLLTLPALTASLAITGYVTRMTRASMLEELKKPYVRTATLKGIPYRRVIFAHALRNALLPTIAVIALSIGWLMGGLVVIENVFNFPGIGSLLVTAVTQKNLPVLQAISVLIVFFYAFANLISDLLFALLNPRIRLS